MSEASDSIATEESPPAADVDELLDRVESLAQEITTETDVEAPVSDSTAPPITGETDDPQTSTADVAPEAPPDSSGAISEELNDLLHDPEVPAEESAAPDSSSAEIEETASSAEDQERESRPVDAADAVADEPTAIRTPRPPLRRRVLSAIRWSVHAILALRAVPVIVVNGFLKILLAVDLPFANLSAGTKRILGYVALATLATGILSWILPELMNQNPFAEMDAHTVIEG